MRKNDYIYILLILIFLTIIVSYLNSTKENKKIYDLKYSSDEFTYIEKNNIDVDNLNKYLNYSNASIYSYLDYEKIRKENNCSHLEAINLHHYPNYYSFYKDPKMALFINTNIALVNKAFFLSKDFVPNNLIRVDSYNVNYIKRENEVMLLNSIALSQYYKMYLDALKNNIILTIFSGYRSYEKQEDLYYNVLAENDDVSSKPGHSEHQTGLAIDISSKDIGLTNHFKDTKSYQWLINNSYKYGFILRYPENKKHITGYEYEPWHFRYVGLTSEKIALSNLTLEEYLINNIELNNEIANN